MIRQEEPVYFSHWVFNFSQSTLEHLASNSTLRLEPKVSELLWVLVDRQEQVVSKDELMETLWPDTVVGEDTLARTISRLRSALSDSAKAPRFVETIPKRGYRFMVSVSQDPLTEAKPVNNVKHIGLLGAFALMLIGVGYWFSSNSENLEGATKEKIQRADALYMRFDKESNEAALALYQEALTIEVSSRALAGSANALVQRVIRWPNSGTTLEEGEISLTGALRTGQLRTDEAKLVLDQALVLAEQAVQIDRSDVQAIKALGFVHSARGNIHQAIRQYEHAIAVEPTAWRSMINLGELLTYTGQQEAGQQAFIKAFYAMQTAFASEPQHVEPWQPQVGLVVAEQYHELGRFREAVEWSRKVLELSPFDRAASTILIKSLMALDEPAAVAEFCASYSSKLAPLSACQTDS